MTVTAVMLYAKQSIVFRSVMPLNIPNAVFVSISLRRVEGQGK